jgi:hypothetical protein
MPGDEAVPRPSVADRAKQLATEATVIDSLKRFQGKPHYELPQQTWFFAANSNLAGAVRRLSAAPTSWRDWDEENLGWRRRTVLANLAGLDPQKPPRTQGCLEELKVAFNHWPAERVAVFQGGDIYDEDGRPIPESRRANTNICNIYVSEALFADGVDQRDAKGKYFSAKQIYEGLGPRLVQIEIAEASEGDIAAWGSHVEVVVGVDPATGTFCTVGTYGPELGQVVRPDGLRRLDNPLVRFFRVRPVDSPMESSGGHDTRSQFHDGSVPPA